MMAHFSASPPLSLSLYRSFCLEIGFKHSFVWLWIWLNILWSFSSFTHSHPSQCVMIFHRKFVWNKCTAKKIIFVYQFTPRICWFFFVRDVSLSRLPGFFLSHLKQSVNERANRRTNRMNTTHQVHIGNDYLSKANPMAFAILWTMTDTNSSLSLYMYV